MAEMIFYLLLFCIVLLGAGSFADWWYKRNEISYMYSEENEEYASEFESSDIESHDEYD